ncbi:hypothetical protein COOONC_21233 [Cooperia oncophora]
MENRREGDVDENGPPQTDARTYVEYSAKSRLRGGTFEAARSSMKMKKRWTPSTMKILPRRSRTSPIGAAYAPASRQHSEISGRQSGTSGQDALNFMAYIQANACISPGIFKRE